MRTIKYNQIYGKKSFKIIMTFVKDAFEELKYMKECWHKEEDFEIKKQIEFDVFLKMRYLNNPVYMILKMEDDFLDYEESEIYKWSSLIVTKIGKELLNN